jgi:hypothetical protein
MKERPSVENLLNSYYFAECLNRFQNVISKTLKISYVRFSRADVDRTSANKMDMSMEIILF